MEIRYDLTDPDQLAAFNTRIDQLKEVGEEDYTYKRINGSNTDVLLSYGYDYQFTEREKQRNREIKKQCEIEDSWVKANMI